MAVLDRRAIAPSIGTEEEEGEHLKNVRKNLLYSQDKFREFKPKRAFFVSLKSLITQAPLFVFQKWQLELARINAEEEKGGTGREEKRREERWDE